MPENPYQPPKEVNEVLPRRRTIVADPLWLFVFAIATIAVVVLLGSALWP
jgi:hypothetical protein